MEILYTDNFILDLDSFGLVISFMQSDGEQKKVIARVGMSKLYAERFFHILDKIINNLT